MDWSNREELFANQIVTYHSRCMIFGTVHGKLPDTPLLGAFIMKIYSSVLFI